MSWASADVADLYLGLDRAAFGAAAAEPLVWHRHDDLVDGAAALLARVSGGRRRWRGRRLRLWLSGALVPTMVVPPIDGLRSAAEAATLVAARLADRDRPGRECEIVIDGVPRRHASIAIAIDRRLRDHLLRTARRYGDQVASIRPWWAGALDRVDELGSIEFFAAEDTDTMTILRSDGDSWVDADSMRTAGAASTDAWWARRRIAADVPDERSCRVRLPAGGPGDPDEGLWPVGPGGHHGGHRLER